MTKKLTNTWENVDLYTEVLKSADAEVTVGGDLIMNGYMFTADGGVAVQITNETGSASVKGSLVASGSVDDSFILEADEYDTIGVVYEDGVDDGAPCWVTVYGKAKCLLADATASTAGNWVHSTGSVGRCNATLALPSGSTIGELQNHFKEIGHCLESKTAGTDVLALVSIHFN